MTTRKKDPIILPTSTPGIITIDRPQSNTAHLGFSGCFRLMLNAYVAKVDIAIANDDKAIADFVSSLKKYIATGVVTPPPPIPPTVENNLKNKKTRQPAPSIGSIGNTGLCTHIGVDWLVSF